MDKCECGFEAEGRVKIMTALAKSPAGALLINVKISTYNIVIEKSSHRTHLNRNTHFHCPLSVIAPPIKGPTTLASAKTVDINAMYLGICPGGMIVGAITRVME
jgi:hypothetical protein